MVVGMAVGGAVGAGVQLSDLASASATVGAGAIPTRTIQGHITMRRLQGPGVDGHGCAFGAMDTGHIAALGAAGKKSPPEGGLLSFHANCDCYFHSRTSTK
jgi:hypothetical protein